MRPKEHILPSPPLVHLDMEVSVATPLVPLSPFPPFRSLTTGPPPILVESSGSIVGFPTLGDRRLSSVVCTPEQEESGLGAAAARLPYANHQGELRNGVAKRLGRHVPRSPVYPTRIPELRSRGITDEEIRQAAAHALAEAPWDEALLEKSGDEQPGVRFRLDRLDGYLNREVTSRLLGAGAEGRRERMAEERLEAQLALSERRRRSHAASEALVEIRHQAVETKAQMLTEAQRAVYLLVERDGLTPKEAGQELGISGAAARNRLHRARESLAP